MKSAELELMSANRRYEEMMLDEESIVRALTNRCDSLETEYERLLASDQGREKALQKESSIIRHLQRQCHSYQVEAASERQAAFRVQKESVRIANLAKRDMALADEAMDESYRRFNAATEMLRRVRGTSPSTKPSSRSMKRVQDEVQRFRRTRHRNAS